GLAPTLIIVRAAYGKTIESVNQVVSTLQFNVPAELERSIDVSRAAAISVHVESQAVEGPSEEQLEKETV
ncbi:hypothetical protein V5O48_013306, partial [Marasmius crinis-equi]